MIRGYFSGIVKTLEEMKRITHKLNGEGRIEDISRLSNKLKNTFIDYSLMEPVQWGKVAVFDYEPSEDEGEFYVIYKDQYEKELGSELVSNIIRKKIEISTIYGKKQNKSIIKKTEKEAENELRRQEKNNKKNN
ncbi:MAG: hypothetical protein ABIC91_07665 [Nanoarchaeota archaeon]